MRRPIKVLPKALLISFAILAATGIYAQDFIFCVDVPASLGGTVYLPNQVIQYSGGAYSLYANTPVGLAADVHIDALALLPDGSLLFSADAPFTVGTNTYLPSDVVKYSTGSYSVYWSGSSISPGANVDAIGFASNGDLLISLDAPEKVGALTFEPEDIIRAAMIMTVFFDGSASGIPSGADVTGFDLIGSDVYLNFDIPVNLGGTVYNPWDLVKYSGGVYSLYFREAAFPPGGAMTDFHFPCSAPVMTTNNSAADPDPCADGGVLISWPQDPDSWGDGWGGTRTYDVFRSDNPGTPLLAGIAYGTLTYTDATGLIQTEYTYTVRYNNGCGFSTTTAGAPAADWVNPGEVGGGMGSGNILEWTGKADIKWPANPLSATYSLYRGAKIDLPALLTNDPDSCLRYAGVALTLGGMTDLNLGAGDFYWYLVTGTNDGGCEGTAGNATAGQRKLNYSGPCP